jgi:hypothetical protein
MQAVRTRWTFAGRFYKAPPRRHVPFHVKQDPYNFLTPGFPASHKLKG